MTDDVIVAGGGPTGLMLACELRLAGLRPVVLERLAEVSTVPKANGLGGQIVHMLDHRGLLDRFRERAERVGPAPFFQFGALPMDLTRLGTNPLHVIVLSQPGIERLLNERAVELGVEIRRGHEVTGVTQDAEQVRLAVRGPDGDRELRARYVVGCDGASSLIRKQSGIGFPGTTDHHTRTHILADVVVDDAVIAPDRPGLVLAGLGAVPYGVTRTARGVVAIVSFRPGIHRLAVIEWSEEPVHADEGPADLAELDAAVERVLGARVPMSRPEWLVRLVNNTRQADRYRAGRVLLAGDAAHVHSGLGGPGLNLGLLDAINLGWKLAAQVQGWAPPALLDTYHAERHPVGRRVLMQSKAQAALLGPGEDITRLRELFGELLEHDGVLSHMADMMAGADVRYAPSGGPADGAAPAPDRQPHPAVGGWLADFPLTIGTERTRLADLMNRARPLLLDLGGPDRLADAASAWKDRVDIVTAAGTPPTDPARALLVRPDGYVAWAAAPDTAGEQARATLLDALTTWFGPA
ncbi:FAD-dependent monooxygenase [Actinomadura opuntiae]|uniref:FAD-dependent monooxygenase n=1 Tax=Actinomadura sp. OS1-43 TaxID=604315 RepID=UPI00255AEB8E|nr:FAD-dependent monooxygenase [Actinomadura sp. OS1-43]MDL4815444.1 FAD-dependent monooxygenase [Actinomadura sp. OS1-43]